MSPMTCGEWLATGEQSHDCDCDPFLEGITVCSFDSSGTCSLLSWIVDGWATPRTIWMSFEDHLLIVGTMEEGKQRAWNILNPSIKNRYSTPFRDVNSQTLRWKISLSSFWKVRKYHVWASYTFRDRLIVKFWVWLEHLPSLGVAVTLTTITISSYNLSKGVVIVQAALNTKNL